MQSMAVRIAELNLVHKITVRLYLFVLRIIEYDMEKIMLDGQDRVRLSETHTRTCICRE